MIIDFSNINGGGGGGYVLPVATSEVLGGVKIGDGVNIDSAGTISVESSDPTILKSVSALPLTAASGDVCVYNDETYVYNTESSVSCSVYNNRIAQNENVTEHIIQWYGELPSDEPIITVRISTWNQTYYITYDSQNNQFKLWNNISMELGNLVSTLPINGEISGVNWGTFNWRCYNNVINVYGVEFNYVLGIYGDWNEVSGAHWEPIDWAYNIANPRKFLMDYNTMPRATKNRLGVAKAGNGLSANFGGEFNVNIATTAQTGMVQIGSGLSITSGGVLSTDIDTSNFVQESELSGYVQTSAMSGYVETGALSGYVQTNRLATTGQTGLVKIGSGISVSEDGTISASGGGIPTGTTGYVLIGQGDAAPTYTAPENITNGVKFWLGTQSEYNALSGTTGYDNSTLYVIK